MLTGVWKMMNVVVVCLLVSLNMKCSLGGKSCMRRRLSIDWQNVHQACRVPFESVRQKNFQLHEIIEHGVGASPADGISEAVGHVEKRCYEQARDSIVAVGMLLKEHEDLRDLVALESKRTPCQRSEASSADNPDAAMAIELIDTINEAKQCLAYVEMAKRGDPKSLYWAWLNNAGSVGARDQACGDVVNGVNALMNESKIPGARIAKSEDGEDILVIEDFPLADRLRKAEINAGLEDILTNAMVVSAATTGSLLAYVCQAWQFLLE